MLESKLLVYRVLAKRSQTWTTSVVALALFFVFIMSLFFRMDLVPSGDLFVPVTSTILIMADWITAILLFAQALVLRARSLQLLAVGYFLSGLFLVLRVLTLPGVLVPPGPSQNIPLWFYLTAHGMLPLTVIAYAWPNRPTDQPASYHSHGRYLVGSVILAGSAILAATMGNSSLPWLSPIFLTASIVMFLIIVAMAMLVRWRHSVLDLWLMLVLWGWFLETALIALPCTGNTAGWYAARSLGLLCGVFVLLALLVETSALYAQTAQQLVAEKQEREHRSMLRDTVTAAIAHEIRQPLAAALINAEASKMALCPHEGDRPIPQDEIRLILDEIIASCQRANNIIESTRSIFGRKSPQKKSSIDMVALLNSTLAMVAGNARVNDVLIELVVDGQPRPVAVNKLQMQQALLNLFQNAIEALSHSSEPRRTLLVRCSPWANHGEDPGVGRGVTIRVEDNGPGIPPDDLTSIFDVFFTTRTNGTGMGLAIAQSVIEEAHGGRLYVEPRAPVGTTFVIHLPCSAGAAA